MLLSRLPMLRPWMPCLEAARCPLEALMKIGNYEYQSKFARTYVAQGLEEGLQKGKLITLFEVLDARGPKVDAEAASGSWPLQIPRSSGSGYAGR